MPHPQSPAQPLAWSRLNTPIGMLSVGADAHYILRVEFGPVDGTPNSLTEQAAAQLREYFAGTRRTFELPLPPAAPAFRAAAQAALDRIPYGSTWSYAQLADAAGSPRAVRAAGTACAKNPLPVIIPCHRVVRADGNLGNYLGGTPAKRWLLDFEAARAGADATDQANAGTELPKAQS